MINYIVQKLLTSKVHEATRIWLQAQDPSLGATFTTRTRLDASFVPGNGDWLAALPNKSQGTLMHRWEYSLALQFRYEVRMLDSSKRCGVGKCNGIRGVEKIDDTECNGDGRHSERHNFLRDILRNMAREAGYATNNNQEPINLFPDSAERPADVLIKGYEGGSDLCIDVAVVTPFGGRGHLETAELRKNNHYKEECRRNNLAFTPFIMDTLGNFGPSCSTLIKNLAAGMANRNRDENIF
ncbi:hypothetical protein R1flu_010403 [Riccia fluitans]|uniref:Uncharacterized protein n=1 Tax=Riccia fluitans TaxID=41844 RepID=A0ABD1Z4W0_9MARC